MVQKKHDFVGKKFRSALSEVNVGHTQSLGFSCLLFQRMINRLLEERVCCNNTYLYLQHARNAFGFVKSASIFVNLNESIHLCRMRHRDTDKVQSYCDVLWKT